MEVLQSDFVPVPIEFKGHVIGRHRAGTNQMIELSGASIVPGTRDQAGFTIKGNRTATTTCKNEHRNNCDSLLKRKFISEKDSYHGWTDPAYQSNLRDEVLRSLGKIKNNTEIAEYPRADMWCYLGSCFIRVPDEADVLQKTWGIEEMTENLRRPHAGENFWRVAFRGRDDIPEDIFERTGYKEITEGDQYISRYDLTYLTRCFYHLRCMVWVAKKGVKERLEDIPIPSEDNNVYEEIFFENEMTRARCRVLKYRRHLKRDILFPGCELDCRFIVYERRHYAVVGGDVPKLEVRRTLSTYLSRLTLTDEDAFGLTLPDHHIPGAFHLLFKVP